MDSEAVRGRQNQREFRYANGRFFTVLNDASGPDGQLIPFLCECADADCRGASRSPRVDTEPSTSTSVTT
jgi:hypothetical protein